MTEREEKWVMIATESAVRLRQARELLGRSLCLIGREYTDEVMLRQDIKAFLEATKPELWENREGGE